MACGYVSESIVGVNLATGGFSVKGNITWSILTNSLIDLWHNTNVAQISR